MGLVRTLAKLDSHTNIHSPVMCSFGYGDRICSCLHIAFEHVSAHRAIKGYSEISTRMFEEIIVLSCYVSQSTVVLCI